MTHKRLTKEQLIKVAANLMGKMEIKSFENDGFDVTMSGTHNNKAIVIMWEIIDGVHEITKIMTEQGFMSFTEA